MLLLISLYLITVIMPAGGFRLSYFSISASDKKKFNKIESYTLLIFFVSGMVVYFLFENEGYEVFYYGVVIPFVCILLALYAFAITRSLQALGYPRYFALLFLVPALNFCFAAFLLLKTRAASRESDRQIN